MKLKLAILVLMVFGMMTMAGDNRLTVPKKVEKINNMIALKDSNEWKKLTEKLDNYDAHYIAYTNKLAQVTDNNSKQAIAKLQNMVDDLHDCIVKMKKIIVDVTNNQ